MAPTTDPPVKPTLPPFWKWLMRVTFAVTMILFLAPTVYMVKYYAVDKPRESEHVEEASRIQDTNPAGWPRRMPLQAEFLPLMEHSARSGLTKERRIEAVTRMGETLRQPYISVKRPLECLMAKAALADLAVHAPDAVVRQAASDELGKVAQGGAVIRR